jgi:choline dehydrogenase-like flavoprotein
MSHQSFIEGPRLELEADYVVVGSGAGGSAAAIALARGGAKVAIVEAGPWRDPSDYPHSAYGGMRDMMDDWGALVTMGRAMWPVVQASLVGGTTVVNSAIAVRTPGDVFDSWRREFNVGTNGMSEAVWRAQDTIERELFVSRAADAALGGSNRLALLADERLGLDGHRMDRYVKDCSGTGQCLQGCREGRKQSTNLNYIPEVMRRGGVVVSCAPAEKVVVKSGRAESVVGRFVHPVTRKKGAAYEVRAKKGVFLAASVTKTPLLLAASGVKPKALGSRFMAHPGSGIFGFYDENVDTNIGATQGWASVKHRLSHGIKLETLSIPLELAASRFSGGGRTLMERLREYRTCAMWIQACWAETQGSIARGPGGKPVVRYSLSKRDLERFRIGMRIVADMHFAAGAKAIYTGIHGFPWQIGPDELHLIDQAPLEARNYIAVLSHLFGGAVMGDDPKTSVTDEYGRVHGVPNLVVADASVMPSNIGVNPQHTIMGLATYFAERALDA